MNTLMTILAGVLVIGILVETYQKIARRDISMRAMNAISLFLVLFVVIIGQDVFRFILGSR